MTSKKLDEQQLQGILKLAEKAEKQAQQMCELILSHSAKYQQWCEEVKDKKFSSSLKN